MLRFLMSIVVPEIDPVAFYVGPVAVRWYGLAYLCGFILGFVVLRHMVQAGRWPLSLAQLDDLVPWLTLGVLAGGRAGWWLFYHRAIDVAEPWYEPLAVWRGGMSFHGGLLGVCIVLVLWSRRREVPLWRLADAVALVAPIGLFFGRLANFINVELVGRPTTLPWAVIFPGETIARHPSQLYEAVLEGPVLLAILLVVLGRVPRAGLVAVSFLGLYSLFRFLVEFVRQPDEQLGFVAFRWMTMGQFLSLITILTAAAAAVPLLATTLAAGHRRSSADRVARQMP